MNAPSAGLRLHVAPTDHAWASDVAASARRAGAEVVVADAAEALVWLDPKPGPALDAVLHEGITWVQLRLAGIDTWIAGDHLDDRRRWTAARGVFAEAVAEHALMLTLAGLKLAATCARERTWNPQVKFEGRLLRDSTVAVIGAGGIGRQIIGYLRPFGPRIMAVTRRGHDVDGAHVSLAADDIDQVWPEADVVILAAPATAATRHLVGAAELAKMRPTAWIVNIARGSLVDTDALATCLARSEIGGAALDVTDPEPLPDGHPLWSEPRALITPHVANPEYAALASFCGLVEDNIRRLEAGHDLVGGIDVDAGY